VLAGSSEDGSYVYFSASNVAEGPGENLVVVHDNGVEWEAPKLIAIADRDNVGSYGRLGSQLAVRVSPDGRYVAFMSAANVTGYDNQDAVSGEPDEEVYLYDATTGRVRCVSCDPSGARPTGIQDQGGVSTRLLVDQPGAFIANGDSSWLAGSIPVENVHEGSLFYRSRVLSDEGRLFFNSPVALVPGDVNGLEDVYEFEPVGVGGCRTGLHTPLAVFSEAEGGCVGLISSGTSSEESAFADASASGGDVFFVTSQGLVPEDVDGAFDMYDAHECTPGSPCIEPASSTAGASCATAEACHGGSSSPAVFGTPGSASFSGAGNLAPTPPPVTVAPKAKAKVLTRAQKLARALKACGRKPKRQRAVCKARARRAFGARTSRAAEATARSGR
jgi:hypothetical protein